MNLNFEIRFREEIAATLIRSTILRNLLGKMITSSNNVEKIMKIHYADQQLDHHKLIHLPQTICRENQHVTCNYSVKPIMRKLVGNLPVKKSLSHKQRMSA
jgi:hypothetical protein